MNFNKYTFILLVALLMAVGSARAQDKQTTDINVTDILAGMPAHDQTQLNNQMIMLLESGEEGLQEVLEMILPPGTGDDTRARFAVESLSRYLSQPGKGYQRAAGETMLLDEIEIAEDTDVKQFLMSQLNYIGGNETVEKLSKYLTDDRLYDPAIRAMRDANPEAAGNFFAAYLDKSSGYPQIALVNAIGELGFSEYKHAIAGLAGTADPELQRSVVVCLTKLGQTDDQRLLIIRKMEPFAADLKAKRQLIDAAGNVKTFLSFVFVSRYLDQKKLKSDAARSLVKIALPDKGKNNGLSGTMVSEYLNKSRDILAGPDHEGMISDLDNYLKEMPDEAGFVSMFNGSNLSGWQGLATDPVKKKTLSAGELKELQSAADQKMLENWSVKDNSIVFNGKGANLCSIKEYGSFELIVDWRITKKGDSGIYLRGTPQIQIWDISRVESGAQVGSGGLYNNKIHKSDPLLVADNPVGDWNTFHITMAGERVTVYLNGQLVVDNVVMENYWDRSIPVFPTGSIELQAHGSDLAFRDIYIKDL